MGGVISSLKKKDAKKSDYSGLKTVKLQADQFKIGKYLAEGGSGKIHVGSRQSDGMLVVRKRCLDGVVCAAVLSFVIIILFNDKPSFIPACLLHIVIFAM